MLGDLYRTMWIHVDLEVEKDVPTCFHPQGGVSYLLGAFLASVGC